MRLSYLIFLSLYFILYTNKALACDVSTLSSCIDNLKQSKSKPLAKMNESKIKSHIIQDCGQEVTKLYMCGKKDEVKSLIDSNVFELKTSSNDCVSCEDKNLMKLLKQTGVSGSRLEDQIQELQENLPKCYKETSDGQLFMLFYREDSISTTTIKNGYKRKQSGSNMLTLGKNTLIVNHDKKTASLLSENGEIIKKSIPLKNVCLHIDF